MKCAFCGTTHEVEELDGINLCKECHEASMQAKKRTEEEEKVEEIREMNEETTIESTGVRCELSIGVTNDGALYFNVHGDNTDLLTIDGLLAFAQRRMRQVWRSRDEAMAAAPAREEE